MRRRRTLAVVVVLAVLGTGACTGSSRTTRAHPGATSTPTGATSGTTLRAGGTRTLAGADRSFGPGVGRIPGAVYQPDVVVIGGGSRAIVGALDNGLSWTISGRAPGAAKLAVGKIMVTSAFATGRVVQMTRVAGNVQVTLAPVSLTDVFRELHVVSSSPVSLQHPLVYSYDDSPLTDTAGDTGTAAGPASGTPSVPASAPPLPRFAEAGPAGPSVPPGVPSVSLPEPGLSPKPVHEGKFDLMPYCCFPSQGVHISYNEPTGRMAATVGIVMGGVPLVDFHIDIDAGGLKEAVLELHGPKAIEFQFDAATKDVSGNYRSPTFTLPLAFAFPIAGIPFTVTMNQSVYASIQLAGQAAFSTKGEYALSGGLGFAYRDGHFGATTPSFTSRLSSLQNATSLSVGINALTLGYGAHFAVGIGVPGFNGGPSFNLGASLAIAKDGSPPQTSLTAGCATAAVYVQGSYGVGYTIPQFVADAVNRFLKLLNAKPIAATGGPHWGPYTLWNPGRGQRCLHR